MTNHPNRSKRRYRLVATLARIHSRYWTKTGWVLTVKDAHPLTKDDATHRKEKWERQAPEWKYRLEEIT